MLIQDFFKENPICAVAFSGGVDSACLLWAAAAYGSRTAAYFVKTPFQPAFELEDARETAGRLGAELRVLEADILSVPEVAANPTDRCYYCKRALFARILEESARDGFPMVLDGCNASDDASDRPGMRALRELGVRSPHRECGIDEAGVRRLARQAGVPVWDKPSYACLATRVPAGTPITPDALDRIARGEAFLISLGLSDFRLRLREDGALLQVRADQTSLAQRLLPEICGKLESDFRQIRLDPVPRASRET